MTSSTERIRAAIHRTHTAVDMQPATAYEAMTRQLAEALADEVKELRADIRRLFWTVIGAVLLAVVMQLGGW